MSKIEKLIQHVRNNPKEVHIDDACKIAEKMGFVGKNGQPGTSHKAYMKHGDPVGLNFQKKTNGKIPPYQARQLIEMIDKYWEQK